MSDSTKKTTNTNSSAEKIKRQEKEIEELKKQLDSVLQALQANTLTVEKNDVTEEKDINPRKKVKVTSLTFGTLSLYAPNRDFLTFKHYGQTHSITYAQLCDYVNAGRTAAENGLYYIHNSDMVEDLDLTESYKKVINPSIVEDIINGNLVDFDGILSSLSADTKDTLGEVFATKIYGGELTDLNKVDSISRALNIDLMKKVEEMKTIEEMLNTK